MTLVEFFKKLQEEISAAAIHLEDERTTKCAFVLGNIFRRIEQWIEAYSDEEENDE